MSLYYLSIPIVIGIMVGGFLGTYGINSNDSEIITSAKLVENGSPFLGNPECTNHNIGVGRLSVHILLQISSRDIANN